MNRDKEIQLLKTSLDLASSKVRPLDDDEVLVPTTDYISPERFEREREAVFANTLNVATLSSAVAEPGDFVTVDVVGTPVLVSRGDDGVLRAFLNVCRHRGAKVERRAQGRCKRFVCPYHAWTYNNDGSLHRVRHPEGFPTLNTKDHGLVEVPCRDAAGLVFVCPTPGATPRPLPEELVLELEHMLGPRPTAFSSSARVWNANWKLIVEGGIESYHFVIAHKDTIAPFFTDTLSTWERIGEHIRSVLPKRSILELADRPEAAWDIREHAHIVYTIHPNAMILLQKTHFDLIVMNPIAPDRTLIEVHTVGSMPQTGEVSENARTFLEKNHAFSVQTLNEDFAIGEEIQHGLGSGANSHLRFARFEGALTDWRRQLDAQLERSTGST